MSAHRCSTVDFFIFMVYAPAVMKKLSQISEVILGHSFRGAIIDDPLGKFAVLQAKNIGEGGTLSSENLTRTAAEGARPRAFVQDRDVLLTNRGVFRAAVWDGNATDLLAASSLYIIRSIHPDEVIPEFIMIFLNSREGQALLSSLNRGTLIRSLPKSNLEMLEIPVPDLATQQLAIDIHQNYQERSALYLKEAQLNSAIATQAISILLSQ